MGRASVYKENLPLKFMYSKKATKNCVAFLENLNFSIVETARTKHCSKSVLSEC